jgi:hypothetical protein
MVVRAYLPLVLASLLSLFAGAFAMDPVTDPPSWLVSGILQVETESTCTVGGLIHYNRQGGPGAGPFQLNADSVHRVHASPSRLEVDMRYADRKARALMCDLYLHEANGDWFVVAEMWRFGPTGYKANRAHAREYAHRVENIGKELHPESIPAMLEVDPVLARNP